MGLSYEREGGSRESIPWWSGEATTDASGRFVLERVQAGPGHRGAEHPRRDGGVDFDHLLGRLGTGERRTRHDDACDPRRQGATVVGKVAAPAAIAGRVDWKQGDSALSARDRRADPMGSRRPDRARISGRRARQRRLVPARGRRGRKLDLVIVVNEPPADPPGPPTHKPIGTARRLVTVPEMPGGRSDEPMDLGTIPLEPIKEP